jgi:lysophospholipase L1-like esterase/PKD repeat protein
MERFFGSTRLRAPRGFARAAGVLASFAALLAAAPAKSQELRFIAFGDSITEGYGDDSQQGGGYPGRLQRWLRQRGYDATVTNEGVGGETTGEALSRVDSVLEDGGDYFLLMEGTNDVSQRVSTETILFNLNELAARAEAAGMVALHGTCIPRLPIAHVDGDNAKTSLIASSIVDLGELAGRGVADHFTLFESLPNLFDDYYIDDPQDTVGHPNGDGYQQMGGLWLETVLGLLEAGQVTLVPPSPPVPARTPVVFQAQLQGSFERLEWEFGDGGFASSETPLEVAVLHVYLSPGTYTARLTGRTSGGAQVVDEAEVTVTSGGGAPWASRTTLVPVVERGSGSAPADLRTDLAIANTSQEFALVDLLLVPEIEFDQPPPMRRLLLGPDATTAVDDAIADLYGLSRARGALLVTYRAPPSVTTAPLSIATTLALADDPSAADGVAEIGSGAWSAAEKSIPGISGGATTVIDLAVANLDGVGGYVRLDLFDALGGAIDGALFELQPGEVRLRRLTDLYRRLELRPQPFTATFRASGIRFAATAVTADALAGEVEVRQASP